MAKPEGIIRKTKDNSRKNYRAREEWQRSKRSGRPKQVWRPAMTIAEIDAMLLSELRPIAAHWAKIENKNTAC